MNCSYERSVRKNGKEYLLRESSVPFRSSNVDGRIAARVFFYAAAAIAFLIAAPQVWADANPAGRIEILRGTVNFERAGKLEALKAGDHVFIKDRIITGPESVAEIVFADRSRMKIAADTDLEITEYLYNPAEKIRQGLISLISGKARFAVEDLQEFNDKRFRVQTRTAMVGSRDTDFIVAYDPELPRDEVCREGLAAALCLENSIIVTGLEFPDKPALLTANMISQVCGPNVPTPPRFATPAELARILAGFD
jgi:hypothetical protein